MSSKIAQEGLWKVAKAICLTLRDAGQASLRATDIRKRTGIWENPDRREDNERPQGGNAIASVILRYIAKEKGFVAQDKARGPWRLTDEGRKWLDSGGD